MLTATGQKQVPWENHALTAKFYFNPSAAAQAPALAGEAAQAWIAVQGTTSEAVLEEYIRRFPDSVYAGFAKARLGELRSKSESSWWPLAIGQAGEAGEAARHADKRRADEARSCVEGHASGRRRAACPRDPG